jgi:uncharacterized protein YndB with AHSA1/START domain
MKWILRAVLGLAGLVLLAVVVMLIIGRRRDAGRLRYGIDIERTAPQVFRWVSEPEKLTQWVGWLVEVRALPGTDGVGGRRVFVMDDPNMKQKIEIEVETVASEPPHLLAVRIHSKMGFTGETEYRLSETSPGKTRLEYVSQFRFHHWFARLMEPIVSSHARGKLVQDLERLKSRAEAER